MSTRKVDRSKRIAVGSSVDPRNIISGSRTKKIYDYKTMTVLSENENKQTEKVTKPVKVKQTPTEEKENVEKVVEKMSKLNLKEKKQETVQEVKKPQVVEKVETPVEVVVQPVQQESKVESKPEKKVKAKKDVAPKTELSTEVMKQIQRLKGVREEQVVRQYKETYDIPATMLQFLDTRFPGELVNEKFRIPATAFESEFAIEDDEANEFKFLRDHPDAMLIGDGDKLIVTLIQDKKQDLSNFNIYVLEDEQPDKVDGPYKLSEYLKNSTLVASK